MCTYLITMKAACIRSTSGTNQSSMIIESGNGSTVTGSLKTARYC